MKKMNLVALLAIVLAAPFAQANPVEDMHHDTDSVVLSDALSHTDGDAPEAFPSNELDRHPSED